MYVYKNFSLKGYVGNQFTDRTYSDLELNEIYRRLLYRHIAWLYTLRSQLLVSTEWEHINVNKLVGRVTEARCERWGVGMKSG